MSSALSPIAILVRGGSIVVNLGTLQAGKHKACLHFLRTWSYVWCKRTLLSAFSQSYVLTASQPGLASTNCMWCMHSDYGRGLQEMWPSMELYLLDQPYSFLKGMMMGILCNTCTTSVGQSMYRLAYLWGVCFPSKLTIEHHLRSWHTYHNLCVSCARAQLHQ